MQVSVIAYLRTAIFCSLKYLAPEKKSIFGPPPLESKNKIDINLNLKYVIKSREKRTQTRL